MNLSWILENPLMLLVIWIPVLIASTLHLFRSTKIHQKLFHGGLVTFTIFLIVGILIYDENAIMIVLILFLLAISFILFILSIIFYIKDKTKQKLNTTKT